MSKYFYLGAALAIMTGWLGSLWFAFDAGKTHQKAQALLVAAAITETRDQARQGTADALATFKPNVQVINQKVRETVRVERVYSECVHPAGVLDDINRALGAGPAGGGKLPTPDAPR